MKQQSVSSRRQRTRSANGQQEEVAHLRAELAAAHARIAELDAQLAASVRQTRLVNERLNTILTVSAALLITHEIDTVLQVVVREAVHLFPDTSGALLFWSIRRECGCVSLRAAAGRQACLCCDQVRVRRGVRFFRLAPC